jgi:RES domain-containing protein
MDVFRISQTRYADKLSASGAPNRWNKDNEYVIYTSQSRALCTLEMVAPPKRPDEKTRLPIAAYFNSIR